MTADDNRFLTQPSDKTTYFIPKNNTPVGTVVEDESTKPTPKLFTPFKIKGLNFTNRIGVSPMCMYSAAHDGPDIGKPTPFHFAHYSSFALRGPGLIIVEASAVSPEGRLSPEDLGIWSDEQALEFKKIVELVHSQGGKIGIQLGHGGRKSSGTAMYNHLMKGVGEKEFGWSDVPGKIVGPSAISFKDDAYAVPTELSIEQIEELVIKFKEAAKRAYEIAGFDFVEIHGAHGYLISTFLSPVANKRTDKYGGSFENRIRFLLEIVDAVKDDKHPLFVRISASENSPQLPESWTIDDSIKLADHLIEHGVDVLDASSGGINKDQERKEKKNQGYQVPLAKAIKQHVGEKLLVATVGNITEGQFANQIVENGDADIVLSGSQFLKNPGLTWAWADELGVRQVHTRPYEWPFYPPPLN